MMANKYFQERREAGDTLIEVLVSIVVISIVIVAAYNITNQGLRIEQNSIERTQASQTISGQAETLRSIRDLAANGDANAKTQWAAILARATTVNPSYATCAATGSSLPFYLNPNNATVVNNTQATSQYFTYWVEAYRSPITSPFVDFHVRGCWQGVGQARVQSIGSVVRLVVPQ